MASVNPRQVSEYEAVCFINNDFPISPQKCKLDQGKSEDNEDKKLGFDPNAINSKIIQLVRFVHGSLESKVRIIEEFNELHPECSKNQIERKLNKCFIKDKRGEDPRHRIYAGEQLLQDQKELFP
jgi:hypothetical protein